MLNKHGSNVTPNNYVCQKHLEETVQYTEFHSMIDWVVFPSHSTQNRSFRRCSTHQSLG